MAGRSAVARMVKMVAAEVAEGSPGDAAHEAMEAIGQSPELAADLLALIIKEGAKARPNDDLLSAYCLLLEYALEQVRFAADRKSIEAVALADDLRRTLSEAGAAGRIGAPFLHLVLHLFASAKLEMGDELRDLMQRMMEADTETAATIEPSAWGRSLSDMVVQLKGDTFAIHGFLEQMAASMPETMRTELVTAAFGEGQPAIREAIIGFLCSEWPPVRGKVAELLELAAPRRLVSATMLRRMIGVRNWLPAEHRPMLDRAIKACRQNGVECASWPKAATGRVLATGIDGAGAHSVLVVLPEGRKHVVAALLGKLDSGVRDAWVGRGMSKADLSEVEERFAGTNFLMPTTFAYAVSAARFLLAVNVAAGTMPPFGLLDFAEAAGLDNLNPEPMPADRLIADLLNDTEPERRSPAGIRAALSASAQWSVQHPMLECWFDDSEEVRRLLAKRAPKQRQITALLTGPLQARRRTWAQHVAWTAYALKHQTGGPDWQDFAVVARELLGERPLGEIPLMHIIAETTIAANRLPGIK